VGRAQPLMPGTWALLPRSCCCPHEVLGDPFPPWKPHLFITAPMLTAECVALERGWPQPSCFHGSVGGRGGSVSTSVAQAWPASVRRGCGAESLVPMRQC
jgi:hypothetical protein